MKTSDKIVTSLAVMGLLMVGTAMTLILALNQTPKDIGVSTPVVVLMSLGLGALAFVMSRDRRAPARFLGTPLLAVLCALGLALAWFPESYTSIMPVWLPASLAAWIAANSLILFSRR